MNRAHFITQGAHIAHNPPRPIQNPLTFGREALKPRSPEHQLHAQLILELANGRGQRRLGDTANLGGTAKMAFGCKGDEHFQLVDHFGRLAGSARGGKGGI